MTNGTEETWLEKYRREWVEGVPDDPVAPTRPVIVIRARTPEPMDILTVVGVSFVVGVAIGVVIAHLL